MYLSPIPGGVSTRVLALISCRVVVKGNVPNKSLLQKGSGTNVHQQENNDGMSPRAVQSPTARKYISITTAIKGTTIQGSLNKEDY